MESRNELMLKKRGSLMLPPFREVPVAANDSGRQQSGLQRKGNPGQARPPAELGLRKCRGAPRSERAQFRITRKRLAAPAGSLELDDPLNTNRCNPERGHHCRRYRNKFEIVSH